jgi:putative hemolysin
VIDLPFVHLAVLAVLLAFSFFFSGTETAAFSLNQLEKERLRRGKPSRFLLGALQQPEEILATILLGNMIVNLMFASVMDTVVQRIAGERAWFTSVLAGALALLLLGEMTPKNVAIRHPASFFAFSMPLLLNVHVLLSPLRRVLDVARRAVVAFVSGRLRLDPDDSRTLITSTLQVGVSKGLLHPSELAATESFLEFRDKTAADIMIPRTRLSGVEAAAGLEAVIERLRRDGGRGPVLIYDRDIDHLKGYMVTRDLLASRFGVESPDSGAGLLRPFYPVPESKPLFDLMQEMIAQNTDMALVLDEYGGTAGVIPFHLLVGDFLQFFYPGEERARQTSEGVYRLPGEYPLEALEGLLGIAWESESRTVGGLIIERLGEIPAAGATLVLGRHELVVRRVSQKRILEVEVRERQ